MYRDSRKIARNNGFATCLCLVCERETFSWCSLETYATVVSVPSRVMSFDKMCIGVFGSSAFGLVSYFGVKLCSGFYCLRYFFSQLPSL